MTDGQAGGLPEAAEALRGLLRRAGHELRNAQSSAAVNLEVVRSRLAAGGANAEALRPFAENAAHGLDDSARIADGMIALHTAVMGGLASGTLSVRERTAQCTSIDLSMPAESAERLAATVAGLAESVGVGVERTARGVILRIPPDS